MSPLINGINYNVDVHQKDDALPYLILLHGFMGSGKVFTPLISHLKSCCNPITLDLLGHGKTDGADLHTRFNVNKQIADLHQIIQRLPEDSLFLHGYSMGGRLALRYALNHPEQLRGLILESTNYGLEDETEIASRKQTDEQRAQAIEGDFQHFVEEWQQIPLFQQGRTLPESKKITYQNIQQHQRPQQMAYSLRGFGTAQMPSVKAQLARLKLPVLLIAGQGDDKYTNIADLMHQRLTNCKLEVVPGAGHRVHLQKPQIIAKHLQSFIINH